MKDIEKIITDLQAWVGEDKENRAIALIAVQKLEDKENGYCSQQHTVTNGINGYLVDAFRAVLYCKNSGLDLREILEHAMRYEAMMGLKIAKEGKEVDHED